MFNTRRKRCQSCNGVLKRLEHGDELLIFLFTEILLWGGVALIIFGAILFKCIGGVSILLSIAVMIWTGLIRKSIFKCKVCGTEVSE